MVNPRPNLLRRQQPRPAVKPWAKLSRLPAAEPGCVKPRPACGETAAKSAAKPICEFGCETGGQARGENRSCEARSQAGEACGEIMQQACGETPQSWKPAAAWRRGLSRNH